MITAQLLRTLRPDLPAARAEITATKLQAAFQKYGIISALEQAHALAQICHESGFNPVAENLNYSAAGLRNTWPTRFNVLSAAQYARRPEAIANRVYADRMGNGSEASGDGWAYRGRGLLQITGRSNYRMFGGLVGYDLENDPSLALQIGIGCLIACAYWQSRGLGRLARNDDLEAVTRGINGGLNGLADRARCLALAKTALHL